MIASLDMVIRLLRRVVPNTIRRWLSGDLGCKHDLVYDDISDVYCKRCGKDFT